MKALSQKSLITAAAILAASGTAYAANVGITYDLVSTPNTASGSTGVTVNATVAPVLTMDISTGTLNLGALPTDLTYSNQSLNLEIATNANGGATVTAASAHNGLLGAATSHVLSSAADNLPNESYVISSDVSGAAAADLKTGAARTGLASGEFTSTKTVYAVNGPERLNATTPDAVVTIGARADTATPADAYQDTVTFTVSATF